MMRKMLTEEAVNCLNRNIHSNKRMHECLEDAIKEFEYSHGNIRMNINVDYIVSSSVEEIAAEIVDTFLGLTA